MRRLPACFLLLLLLTVCSSRAADIYVSLNGADSNSGTKDHPLASIAAALRKARELRRLNDESIANGIHIIIAEGVYHFYESLMIRPEDAGTAASPTIIEAASGDNPVFSGGIEINNWKRSVQKINGLPAVAQGKVWVADLNVYPELTDFRQLWVNDVKAVRAKLYNGDSMGRILNWNKKDAYCVIPLNKKLADIKGAEMFIHQWWAIAILRIKKIVQQGDSAVLFFQQPESKIQNEHPWPAPWLSKETGNSAFNLTNAIEFLDEPGEWWLDKINHKLYYWPKQGEDLIKANVVVPVAETIVKIEGIAEHPVTNVFFKNISFEHSSWLRPSQFGLVPHQAGMYMTEAYKLKPAGTKENPHLDNQAWIGRPAAAIQVSWAANCGFDNCQFKHTASTALDFFKGSHNNYVNGSLFKDIGGTAILAGVFADEAQEIHLTYKPKDEREVCDSLRISNNLITDATNEDWGCVGIGVGYTRNTEISHNEIENVGYTGISIGWGWNPSENMMRNNKVIDNKIHYYGKHNYDCAGIYTLSAQPGSLIAENYIDSIYKAPYAHLPSHWFYLYTDEGSSYITVKDNWTPSEKYLQNANGPGNEWSNNGPKAAASIKQNAGLQTAYQYLAKEKTAAQLNLPINEEHFEIIELVQAENKQFDLAKLRNLLAQYKMDSNAVYQWKNHFVVFDKVIDVMSFTNKLKNAFPDAQVRSYPDLFYHFDKSKNCDDKTVAAEWDHVILTANMVADPKKQKAYLDYHATQFQKWPEISKGFCNASFQQLLIFKNGRQLMLVISIPKGESLDKLNPKTTENNPRVVEWNNIMKNYQEGIEGTKKGETWVFFKNVKM
ncbi:MAG: L-rhamnose mutarotase [Chitinophagaceae bacterium]